MITQAIEVDPSRDVGASEKVHVTWYSDPHNVWCWGCEPAMRRLEVVYPDAVEVEVRMGGLFEDFRPVREQWARMSGGRWKDSVLAFFEAVASQHRMPMASAKMLETTDDFDSTWPACFAAKAADLQGREAGRRYLRALREAWCLDGRGIHRADVQVDVAREAGLDTDAFARALEDGTAKAAFQADREVCEGREVAAFPTFEIRRAAATVRLDGWQPWEVFEDLLRKVDPTLRPRPVKPSQETVTGLLARYGRLATREVAAVLGGTDDDAELLLEELEGRGEVLRKEAGASFVWETPGRRSRPARPSHEESP